MTGGACFLMRGDIRFDTRLENLVHAYTTRGVPVTVIQGGDSDQTFLHEGATVVSFRSTERGPYGFLKYWLRASRLASRVPARVWWAAELYSLPIALWCAVRSGGKAGYDSRELFAHLGALKGSALKQRFWYGLERALIGRVDGVITSGSMDSDYLEERYHVERPQVVRNLPRYEPPRRSNALRETCGISDDTPVCLYQGWLLEGRGVGIMLELAESMPEVAFVFIGDGWAEGGVDRAADVDRAAARLPNVHRIPKVPHAELARYTASATLGFALIEPITLSYLLALPNKLFEYIMAGTPVVASCAPQMEAIVEQYHVGAIVPFDCVGDVHAEVRSLLADPRRYAELRDACFTAAKSLCWEAEEESFAGFASARGLL